MRSVKTERFRKAYDGLPKHIQEQADKAFSIWKRNENHPSISFKKIHKTKPVYSVRVTLSYRALGMKQGDTMIWFWIGSHPEYEKLIAAL